MKTILALFLCAVPVWAGELNGLPANEWTLLHAEDDAGGKEFAKAVFAPNTGRIYLWGTGGEKAARNVFRRYELEAFDLESATWQPAFPDSKDWSAEDFPPFRIFGQSGPDGLKFDEGPRLRVVGGYHSVNRVQWWDFDGVRRPSPVLTFNQACWDSKRNRVLYYSDGQTFALDPETNTWTDLETPNYPATCRFIAWGSMAYDSKQDRVLLFGGGLGTNPEGGAPAWIYHCAENRWERPELEIEPPLRCNGALAYDEESGKFVLFGGYNQAAALNDTWVFDSEWRQLQPKLAPPPMFAPAGAAISGHLLICGNDARKVERRHKFRSSAVKETWALDVAEEKWKPVHADLELPRVRWLTATAIPKENTVVMVAFGRERKTLALRFDPNGEPVELPGAKPGEIAWKYPEQKESLENAPPAEPEKHAEFLKNLPPNEFVDANPPGLLISKTWSTAVIDTDRSEVIYHGGGHSGYSGNDFARYDIANNRWTLDAPPRFPPFLEGTNAGIFGWSYGMIPFSQHTYLWYTYDPVSKSVVYLARPSLEDGAGIRLEDEVFIYDSGKHGYASWIYDSARKEMHPPSFGRSFKNPWHLSLRGTPDGVFAACDNRLYRGEVSDGDINWELFDPDFPEPRGTSIKYHYEFQPLLHDSKRNRLVQLKGDKERVDVFVRSLDREENWSQLETTGNAAIGREAVYLPGSDFILWLADRELFAFDVEERRLAKVDVELPEGRYTHECAMVYDPRHDVCVALIPSRFSGPMQTFLFRFDPRTARFE